MPVRPREMNDQPTEARIRQIIRSILDQEVRRLNTDNDDLQDQIDDIILDLDAAEENIEINARRGAARNNDGIWSSADVSGGSGAEISTIAYAGLQEWTTSIAAHPIAVTLWSRSSFTTDAAFDSFAFDTVAFDEAEEVQSVNTSATVTYKPSSQVFSIDWGSAKSGTLYIINTDDDAAFSVVAVAD